MPPKTSFSHQQIASLLKQHGLRGDASVKRLEVGFTNEVYSAGDNIVKIYVREGSEPKLLTEAQLYRELSPRVLVPKLVAVDTSRQLINKPYMIYRKVPGRPLGHIWHTLNDVQRHRLINQICDQIKLITKHRPNPTWPDSKNWRQVCEDSLFDNLKAVKSQKILTADKVAEVESFIAGNINVMDDQKPTFLFWDAHLDNFIVDSKAELAAVIDLEHTGVFSLDYLLDIVRRMVRYPELNLAPDIEKFARKKDYVHLMDWFKEAWPELFDFPQLERRLDLYELDGILRHLPRYPRAR
ncbi:MAG TPA: aminoglycoside phosphotransferase family protein, partial [Candidatus Saccharimonadales bacterium]|nr:aminoglycoside phosphotransferase family protein [Candidatus Saccharimonadales bacterium]